MHLCKSKKLIINSNHTNSLDTDAFPPVVITGSVIVSQDDFEVCPITKMSGSKLENNGLLDCCNSLTLYKIFTGKSMAWSGDSVCVLYYTSQMIWEQGS